MSSNIQSIVTGLVSVLNPKSNNSIQPEHNLNQKENPDNNIDNTQNNFQRNKKLLAGKRQTIVISKMMRHFA